MIPKFKLKFIYNNIGKSIIHRQTIYVITSLAAIFILNFKQHAVALRNDFSLYRVGDDKADFFSSE